MHSNSLQLFECFLMYHPVKDSFSHLIKGHVTLTIAHLAIFSQSQAEQYHHHHPKTSHI